MRVILLALALLILSGCSAIRVQPVALPAELVAVPPEPLAPDPTTLPNTPIPQPVAAYCAELFFAYHQAAGRLREIAARQPK